MTNQNPDDLRPSRDLFAVELTEKLWDIYNESQGYADVFIPAAVDLVCYLFDRVVDNVVSLMIEADSN